jgi:hypothetical protein
MEQRAAHTQTLPRLTVPKEPNNHRLGLMIGKMSRPQGMSDPGVQDWATPGLRDSKQEVNGKVIFPYPSWPRAAPTGLNYHHSLPMPRDG